MLYVMPSGKLSKKMELVLYLARKSTRMATYDELVDYFVNEKGWSRPLLNAYPPGLRTTSTRERSN